MDLGSIGKDRLQLLDMVEGLPVDNRVGPASVVAKAAADTGPVGRGGVRGVLQAVGRQLAVELVQHYAGADPGPGLFRVDLH